MPWRVAPDWNDEFEKSTAHYNFQGTTQQIYIGEMCVCLGPLVGWGRASERREVHAAESGRKHRDIGSGRGRLRLLGDRRGGRPPRRSNNNRRPQRRKAPQ